MKNLFILKPNKRGTRGIISRIDDLKDVINKNLVQNYTKIPFIQRGDILVCCEKSSSFIPSSEDYIKRGNSPRDGGAGYEKDLVFKVNDVGIFDAELVLYGALRGNGVYVDRVRFATSEEIEKFNKTK